MANLSVLSVVPYFAAHPDPPFLRGGESTRLRLGQKGIAGKVSLAAVHLKHEMNNHGVNNGAGAQSASISADPP